MKITFLGAAQNVTGSKFLLETNNTRHLIDCGLFQERAYVSRNWEKFSVDTATIQSVILTHAHIDHCGYLPKLVQQGFNGPIYCTPPTAEITKLSLLDTAQLQEADAAFKLKRHIKEGRKGPYPEKPLFTPQDAQKVFPYFKNISYQEEIIISDDIKMTLHDAGHILGSAMVKIKVNEGGRERILVFSGDIGRWNRPIVCDPHLFKKADVVFMEATYGNRLHEDTIDPLLKLEEIIQSTYKQGGNIVIPTFAIERAQELIYALNHLLKENRIPHLMIFVDSPMAREVTEIFKQFPHYFDKQARSLVDQNLSLFDFPLLKFTKSIDESKAINHIKGSSIIMAGSGMCNGGRIKHHLMHNIERPESTILFVGYQAEGTLGRQILERPKEVRIFGQILPVRAKIEKINGFSAHADQKELKHWLMSVKPPPEKVFIVHSEKKTAEAFADSIRPQLNSEIIIPQYLQTIEI